MTLCLTRDEIAELTRAKGRAKQVAFLVRNGIRHYLDDRGWPVVTRAAIEGQPDSVQTPAPWKPRKAA